MEYTKVSLKKAHEKSNPNSKLILNIRSESQKDLHRHDNWKISTNRSKQENNDNLYDIELFKKKKKI